MESPRLRPDYPETQTGLYDYDLVNRVSIWKYKFITASHWNIRNVILILNHKCAKQSLGSAE